MGKFGWSYPAGCSGPPDDGYDSSPESEKVWEMLESAGVEESLIVEVCKIVDDLVIRASVECPRCIDAYVNDVLNRDLL